MQWGSSVRVLMATRYYHDTSKALTKKIEVYIPLPAGSDEQ